jgi:hypothetical protein
MCRIPRAPGERAVLRAQHPQPETVLVPMRHVDGEIGLRHLCRAHAAEIAGDFGIEMQCDEVGKVIFAEALGDQPFRPEAIHGS